MRFRILLILVLPFTTGSLFANALDDTAVAGFELFPEYILESMEYVGGVQDINYPRYFRVGDDVTIFLSAVANGSEIRPQRGDLPNTNRFSISIDQRGLERDYARSLQELGVESNPHFLSRSVIHEMVHYQQYKHAVFGRSSLRQSLRGYSNDSRKYATRLLMEIEARTEKPEMTQIWYAVNTEIRKPAPDLIKISDHLERAQKYLSERYGYEVLGADARRRAIRYLGLGAKKRIKLSQLKFIR